jgi:outer membrane biosynthesis protein TonB
MRVHFSALMAVAILVTASVGSATKTPCAQLARAIQLFENFQDEAAAFVLYRLVREAAPPAVAARAHIYLALLRLNQTDAEGAKAEMRKAETIDVLVDLPPGQSPKAEVLFAQVRRELTTVGPVPQQPSSPPAAVPSPEPVSVPTPAPTPVPEPTAVASVPEPAVQASPSHALRWTFVGVGVAAAAVAVVGAVEVASYTNLAGQLQNRQIPAGLTYQAANGQRNEAGTWGTAGLVLAGVAAACAIGLAVAW